MNSQECMDEVVITAPTSGLIMRWEVSTGDKVNAGDPVVTLEVMKMELTVVTPASGKVKSINFKEEDIVAEGDPLAVISQDI